MAGGLVLAALGFGLFTQVDAITAPAVVVAASVIWALGTAPSVTLATDLIVGSAPPEQAGAASAISETGAEFGGALGIAMFGSLGVAVYRSAMADAIPAEVPFEVAQAARHTLGGAIAVADQLPVHLRTPLVEAARAAFVECLQLGSAFSSIGSLGLAILVMVLLRRVPPSSGSEPAAEAEVVGRP